jgi:hypothetical protein
MKSSLFYFGFQRRAGSRCVRQKGTRVDILLQLLVEASVRAYVCRLTHEVPFSRALREFKASVSNRKAHGAGAWRGREMNLIAQNGHQHPLNK